MLLSLPGDAMNLDAGLYKVDTAAMKTAVQRWGNSLAVRIPRPFAEEIHLSAGAEVDLTVADGRLVLAPIRRRGFSLESLLAGIAPSNLHGEIDGGSPLGKEAW